MSEPTAPKMPLDELRRRVEEAEKLLRVARQLAQDELRDPERSERAKDRIASLCSEVNALFPGMAATASPAESDAAGEGDPAEEAAEDAAAEHDDEGGDGEADGGEAEEAQEREEWDIDYEKLRGAIQNPVLMAGFPEAERAQFKAMAEQLLDAHDRHALYARVTEAFEELERTTRAGADEVRRQLALVMTFEELRAKTRQ